MGALRLRHHPQTRSVEVTVVPLCYLISRIVATALHTSSNSSRSSVSILDCSLCLATERIWSTTATQHLPWQLTGSVMGGCGLAAVDNGTTTTVRRSRFNVLCESTTHGRVFLISDPCVGSRLTHQISPRLICCPVIPRSRRQTLATLRPRARVLGRDWLIGRPPQARHPVWIVRAQEDA